MKHIFANVAVDQAVLDRLQSVEAVRVTLADPVSEEPLACPEHVLEETQILFCTAPPANFSDMTSVELIQIASAGYSQLFGLNLNERRIRACNALGVFDSAIAEWALSMMINLFRNLRQMIRNQERGVWDRSAEFQGEIRGSTVGLWGYGGIARETARLCKTLAMNVHVLARSGVRRRENIYCLPGVGDPEGILPDRIFGPDETKAFLGGLDFLVLSMPLTHATEGIVGEAELRSLPRHAFLLNPARGPLVEEQALLRALREKWIAGAALDTHYYYPMPPDHPLWKMENVIMTPHISGSAGTPSFPHRVWDLFSQNVHRYLTGEPLWNELTPAQLAGQ